MRNQNNKIALKPRAAISMSGLNAELSSCTDNHTMVDAHTARAVWGPYTILAGEKATAARRTKLG